MTKCNKIRVNASGSYDILIGENLIKSTGELIKQAGLAGKVAVISDETVDKLYSNTVIESLKNNGFETVKFVFPAGEKNKNLHTYTAILSFLAQNGLTRKDFIVALGGGVVGDMAGFVASTYMRGIDFVQIPTTLLAQIDSSVGGKTAVDLPEGKNLVGAFLQPKLVICDTEVLKTLPKSVFDDGMGEMIKYALLDKKVFDLFSLGVDKNLNELIALSIDYKRKIVEEDEFETGVRKLLNLGHTPAHGIEKLSDYKITHGNAVSMGIKIMLFSACKLNYIDEKVYSKISSVLGDFLSTSPYTGRELAQSAFYDKKRNGDDISIVTIHGIGDCRIEKVKLTDLEEYFN